VAESDRLLSDCTPFKGVPRVRIPLSPPFFFPRNRASFLLFRYLPLSLSVLKFIQHRDASSRSVLN
jgi:hypothetical protein